MASSESQNGLTNKVEKQTLWAVGGVYCFMVFVSVYFFIKTFVQPGCPAIFRQRFFHSGLILNSCCIKHIGRILWVYFYTLGDLDENTVELLDSLPNIIMCILASTIALLWYEIYLSSTILLSPKEKSVQLIICIILFLCINIISIVFHLLFIFDENGNWNLLRNKFKNTVILDSSTNIINTIWIVVSGLLLSRNARIIFISRVGDIISLRIHKVIIMVGIMFIGKSIILIVSLAYVSLLSDEHSNLK
jgi:hypothetical protein